MNMNPLQYIGNYLVITCLDLDSGFHIYEEKKEYGYFTKDPAHILDLIIEDQLEDSMVKGKESSIKKS